MAMTTDQYRLREEIREDLLRTLRIAMAGRRLRDELVDGEPGWVRHERRVMHAAVNQWRARLVMPAVPLEAIEHIEWTAEGHIDYAEKFTLRCADLAVGVGEG